MNIKILEKDINRNYLMYLQKKGFKIFSFEDKIDFENIDGIIIRTKTKIDSDFLNSYKNLKYIFRVGVGLDNINLEETKKRNIIIKNTPGANANAVAELVLWGILSLIRKTYKKWNNIDDRFSFMGDELNNKTIGIVGFGAIGKKVYKLINTFGDNEFLIYDPFLNPDDFKEKNIKFVFNKKELFKNSDIISFHIPLVDNTKDFLGGKDFELLKKNVKIINTSRGGIINEDDLIKFLKENKESGAFIDTWIGEPLMYNKGFDKLENILITPHIGAMTNEANKNMHKFEI